MKTTNLGIIREGKTPPDKRVPFTPKQLEEIIDLFPDVKITVQHSAIRCFQDSEYSNLGFEIKEELNHQIYSGNNSETYDVFIQFRENLLWKSILKIYNEFKLIFNKLSTILIFYFILQINNKNI